MSITGPQSVVVKCLPVNTEHLQLIVGHWSGICSSDTVNVHIKPKHVGRTAVRSVTSADPMLIPRFHKKTKLFVDLVQEQKV
jgi:hypothetical protein